MEVKNSGIPGPSAISWKRKSVEESPNNGNVNKKRKTCASDDSDPCGSAKTKSKAKRAQKAVPVGLSISKPGFELVFGVTVQLI